MLLLFSFAPHQNLIPTTFCRQELVCNNRINQFMIQAKTNIIKLMNFVPEQLLDLAYYAIA